MEFRESPGFFFPVMRNRRFRSLACFFRSRNFSFNKKSLVASAIGSRSYQIFSFPLVEHIRPDSCCAWPRGRNVLAAIRSDRSPARAPGPGTSFAVVYTAVTSIDSSTTKSSRVSWRGQQVFHGTCRFQPCRIRPSNIFQTSTNGAFLASPQHSGPSHHENACGARPVQITVSPNLCPTSSGPPCHAVMTGISRPRIETRRRKLMCRFFQIAEVDRASWLSSANRIGSVHGKHRGEEQPFTNNAPMVGSSVPANLFSQARMP